MSKLQHLSPVRVFTHFETLCGIPHGSGNTAGVSAWCEAFAKERGLWCHRDSLGSVIIKKPASVGYETHPPVILQAHLDMVCEKAEDCPIDFTKDGLDLAIDGEWIFARGTTLGADDGIGVAIALAVLEDTTLAHPPLEVLLTVDEETGMYGAEGLDGSLLSGRRLINLDTGEEGVFTAGCAGGARVDITLPTEYEENALPCYAIAVDGLQGGHSGVEIHQGRTNASIVLGQFLATLPQAHIVRIDGGCKGNVIPSEANCVVACDTDISAAATAFAAAHRTEGDPNLRFTVTPAQQADRRMTAATTNRVTAFLSTVPNGVMAMSKDMAGLVETSLNLGVLSTTAEGVYAHISVRSSVESEKMALLARLETFAAQFGADYAAGAHYPGWAFDPNSALRQVLVDTWVQHSDKPVQVVAVHAGLECGLFCEKLSGLDAVSMGPNMQDIHTHRERLHIPSVGRVYTFLCDALSRL
ncbi:MAG: aminoacyl-histidine dipeptidase [Clostridia bacterium]|nr:aminoacyl-histidine dipeptidase [Clostridia bacterium]